jgi:hypothetical protein
MLRRLRQWLKIIWAKLFRRKVVQTDAEANASIMRSFETFAYEDRVRIFNGSPAGLREALSNHRAYVFVIQVLNPVEERQLIQFDEYVNHVKAVVERNK